jgi:hypothetical protein
MISEFGMRSAELKTKPIQRKDVKARRRKDFWPCILAPLRLGVEFPGPAQTSAKQQHNDNDDEQETDPAAANPDGAADNWCE